MARFVGDERKQIVAELASFYDEVVVDRSPRLVCMVAEGGWGKTRIIQELYTWLQQERQPDGAYWPPLLFDSDQDPMRSRKVIYPEQLVVPPNLSMPWLWWGLRCEQVSNGRKLRALLHDGVQLKAHLEGLIVAAERRSESKDLAFSILGEALALLPGIGQVTSIALAAQELAPQAVKKVVTAFKDAQERRRSEQEPRTLEVASAGSPEVNVLVELVKQFISPELPLILAIDDAHAADPDTVAFIRRIFDLKVPALIVCSAWGATLDDELDEEKGIEPGERETFGGLLDALLSELPDAASRRDLAQLPDEALTELIRGVAPNTSEEARRALIEMCGGNPLALRLNLTSPRVQRSIKDGAIELPPEELKKLPRGFERLISERFEDLAETDQRWLAEAAMQGFEFLPRYLSAPSEDVDFERISAFVRIQPGAGPGRFIEPAVHRVSLQEADTLLSDDEKRDIERSTLEALQRDPMPKPSKEEGGRTWCSLLLRLAESSPDRELPKPDVVAEAAHQLSFIDRDLGLHQEELKAAEAAANWTPEEDADGKARRTIRWAAALRANNEPEAAVQKGEEGLAQLEAIHGEEGSGLRDGMLVLAQAYQQNEQLREALDLARRATTIADDDEARIDALELVSEIQVELREIPAAQETLTEAIEIARGSDAADAETILTLELRRSLVLGLEGHPDRWEAHLQTIEKELGTDHGLYEMCLELLAYDLLLAGDIDRADETLAKIKTGPDSSLALEIEAMRDVFAGGDVSKLGETLRERKNAPFSSKNETALFSQLAALLGETMPEAQELKGPFDFLRRLRVGRDEALLWLLDGFRDRADEWDGQECMFAIQMAAVHLGERLLDTGQPSPFADDLLAEIERVTKERGAFPVMTQQMVQSYLDAAAILKGGDAPPLDEDQPPLIQVRTLAQCAVAAHARGDRELAASILARAYAQMERLGGWASRRIVLLAAEVCESPLCARGWMAVPGLPFGNSGERWEALGLFGTWLFRRGRYTEAEPIERQVLAERIQVNGAADKGTADAKSNLAATLVELGKVEEARDLLRDVADAREEELGGEDPATLSAKRLLVGAEMRLGRFQAARPVQEEVCAGSDDRWRAADKETLARILDGLTEFEAGVPLWEECLELRTRDLGEDHETTLAVMAELAESLRRTDKPDAGRQMAEELLERRLRNEGLDSPATRMAKLLIANCRSDKREFSEAAGLIKEVVDSRAKTLGPTHPLTLEAKTLLGVAFYRGGDFERAQEVEGEVVAAREHELRQARVNAAYASLNFCETLAKLDGGLDGAAQKMEAAIEVCREILGETHSGTSGAIDRLVKMLVEGGRPDLARRAGTEALEALEKEVGPDDPRTAEASSRLTAIDEA